jgi:hypothetical protein
MKRILKNYGQEGLGCDKDQDKGKGKMGKGTKLLPAVTANYADGGNSLQASKPTGL